MTNTDQIIEFLEEQERGMCDDCLSERLHITPRQQVNAICRRLQSDGLILRSREVCPTCSRIKLMNLLAVPAHQANMMHTLCALRNCYAYEQLPLGTNELAVVQGAWAIVDDWAQDSHGDLWSRTTRSSWSLSKNHLSDWDKQELLGLIEDYRQGLLPLIVPLTLLKHHLNRHPVPEWVHQQVYLHPYPKELMLRNHV
jgi:hypothetical protein